MLLESINPARTLHDVDFVVDNQLGAPDVDVVPVAASLVLALDAASI